jgi:hypothetical protein
MKIPRALPPAVWFAVCLGLILITELWIAPARMTAASTTSPIVGTWEGTIDPGAQPKKRIVVHISVGQDGIISGAIDHPDEDTSGIPITAITYQHHVLHLESSSTLVVYDGTLSPDNSTITGTWVQAGTKLALVLKRTA